MILTGKGRSPASTTLPQQALLLVVVLMLPGLVGCPDRRGTRAINSDPDPNKAVEKAKQEEEVLRALLKRALPRSKEGTVVMKSGQGVDLVIPDKPEKNMGTAYSLCLNMLSFCTEKTANKAALRRCAAKIRACRTRAPWKEKPCCPALCLELLKTRVADSKHPSLAMLAITDTHLQGNCFAEWKKLMPQQGPIDCRKSDHCRLYGKCTWRYGKCMATSDADCQRTASCAQQGKCKALGGACVVGSDAKCRKTGWCRKEGRCTLKDGKCVVGSDEFCASLIFCKRIGRCTLKDGKCVVGSDADCRQSSECKGNGKCMAGQGAAGGGAATADTSSVRCIAGSDADCRQSRNCKHNGRCTAESGRCRTASDRDCRLSIRCQNYGACVAADGRCVARADKDCKRSRLCETMGLCTLVDGRCIAGSEAECQKTWGYRNEGRCTFKDGKCGAAP